MEGREHCSSGSFPPPCWGHTTACWGPLDESNISDSGRLIFSSHLARPPPLLSSTYHLHRYLHCPVVSVFHTISLRFISSTSASTLFFAQASRCPAPWLLPRCRTHLGLQSGQATPCALTSGPFLIRLGQRLTLNPHQTDLGGPPLHITRSPVGLQTSNIQREGTTAVHGGYGPRSPTQPHALTSHSFRLQSQPEFFRSLSFASNTRAERTSTLHVDRRLIRPISADLATPFSSLPTLYLVIPTTLLFDTAFHSTFSRGL